MELWALGIRVYKKQRACRGKSAEIGLNLTILPVEPPLAQPSRWPVANSLAGAGGRYTVRRPLTSPTMNSTIAITSST
jgi:hypothetical protein